MSSTADVRGEDSSSSAKSVEGVVFCGGRSRRMGTDKAELEAPGRERVTLLENAIAVLQDACDSVVLATGAEPRYEALGLECVLDSEEDAGPLAGLAAVLARTRATWVCALACDMPGVNAELFRALLKHAVDADLDACLLETSGGVEPLCAVYRNTCREAVSQALDNGERRMVAFHGQELRIGTLTAEAIAVDENVADNLNTRDDYARVQESVRPRYSPEESS